MGTIRPSSVYVSITSQPTYPPTCLSIKLSAHPPTPLQSFPFLSVFCLSFSVYLVISSCYVINRVRKCLSFWCHTQHYGGSVCGRTEVMVLLRHWQGGLCTATSTGVCSYLGLESKRAPLECKSEAACSTRVTDGKT
jgi:hypothetical protein